LIAGHRRPRHYGEEKKSLTTEKEFILLTDRIAKSVTIYFYYYYYYSSELLATDTEVLGSIPGASIFSEKQWVWNGVHSAS
jgi:hypothetical protein